MDKIRIGVIGCANIAKRSVIPALLELEQFQLVAIASRTQEKSQIFGDQFGCTALEGYDRLIERTDIDAVYLPLPTGIHEKWIMKCLENNKHVLSEKSLAMSLESTKRLIIQAKKANLLLMENYMFAYHPQHIMIKNMINLGEIGEIRAFRSCFGFSDLDRSNFRYQKQLGGGALLDVGGYTLKASNLFLGQDLNVQSSVLNYDLDRGDVDIYGAASLTNEEGVIAQVAFGFDNYYRCDYEIWGSKGKITAHKAFTPKPNHQPIIELEKNDETKIIHAPAANHFKETLKEFAKKIHNKKYDDKYDELLVQSKLQDDLRTKAQK